MSELTKTVSLILKGIAIVLVIVSHVAGMFQIRYFTPLGGIGVAIFLLLSGYGLTESRKNNGLQFFWRKRLCAVWIPYFFVEIVFILNLNKFSVGDIFKDLSLITPRLSQIWFLRYLLLCYLVFWLVNKWGAERYRIWIMLAIFVVSIFILREIAAEQALSFWCGCYLAERKEKIPKLKSNMVIWLLMGVGALFLKQFDVVRNSPQIVMNIIQCAIKFPIALFCVGLIIKLASQYQFRCLQKIGKISYELYLVHINLLSIITLQLWGIPLFLLLSIAGSVLLHLITEKISKTLLKSMR